MTAMEAQRILREMQATWAARTLDAGEAVVWRRTLEGLAVDLAVEAVAQLRLTSEWFPSHARFVSTYQAMRRAAEHHAAAERGIPRSTGPPVSPEVGLAGVRAAREALAGAPPLPPARAAAAVEGVVDEAARQLRLPALDPVPVSAPSSRDPKPEPEPESST